jgi:hypothetical protein
MRLIKLALISMVVFFGLLTAMSLLIPAHVRISRAVNIHSSSGRVFYFISNREQWPQWHPAFQNGDAMAQLQHQIRITPLLQTDTSLTVRWGQPGKRPVINGWQLHRVAIRDSATLQWYMDFQLKWYPWQKFSSLLYEKAYGTFMEQGLQNLKRITESPGLQNK